MFGAVPPVACIRSKRPLPSEFTDEEDFELGRGLCILTPCISLGRGVGFISGQLVPSKYETQCEIRHSSGALMQLIDP